MPRRSSLAAVIPVSPPPQADSESESLGTLRTQWRWAAFSQFFFTFSPLFALHDVSVADIEHDLVCNTREVLPRVMQRLLYTLSYDRKVSVNNWQTALRKQYNKRDPPANPIGPEPLAINPHEEHNSEQEGTHFVAEQSDDPAQQNDLTNTNEKELSGLSKISSIDDRVLSTPTPLHELNSTRQSSVTEEQDTPFLANKTEGELGHFKSIDWFELPMLAKLESMHTIAEWQFQNPTRLRMVMKSDDEFATWRIEPIGYDSKRNAYWLIGADRLWIQRAPPKAPKPKTPKRKRVTLKLSSFPSSKSSTNEDRRPRNASPDKKPSASKALSTPSSDRHSRAAKDQAKQRLDAQAKELAELNRQAALASSGSRSSARQASSRSKLASTPRIVGTRASTRLRGSQDDEWQPIPDEWLNKPPRSPQRLEVQKTGLESDEESVSELTELSEDMSDPAGQSLENEVNGHEDYVPAEELNLAEPEPEPEPEMPPENFIEWEMICSTLYEWEHFAEPFEKATHYGEKALYKVLVNDIVPVITQELREIERKHQLEEAIVHRKRSSRIAVRESEKEEARLAAKRKQEEDEKMSRARRLEARRQREEEERLRKENAREQRRMEREAKEEARKVQLAAEEAKALAHAEKAGKKRKSTSPLRDGRKTKTQKANGNDWSNGTRTPAGEDWELACEICFRQGFNLDDGTPMMSCGACSRWQHIQCHDRADRNAGHPRRNWNAEEFICSRCRASQRVQYNGYLPPGTKPTPYPPKFTQPPSIYAPQIQAYGSSSPGLPLPQSTAYPQDHRDSSHYLSGYRNSVQQNYYSRPNGHQYPNMQFPSSSTTHSSLSFSHYQPSQHAVLVNPQKPPYLNAYSSNSSTALPQPFQLKHDSPHIYNSQPVVNSSWNATTPTQASGYPVRSSSIGMASSSSSRHPHSQADNHDPHPNHSFSTIDSAQTSYTRYSTDHHSTTPCKQPVSYQPSGSGR